jgi:transcriptional regulator with XRE-family HTH domain
MDIGKKIKELRKSKGITQEQLAQSLGVSFQAVSKWETNIALPDITLVPILASYFSVSVDELFDFSLTETEKEIESIAEEARNYIESNPDQGRKIIENGLKKYPENVVLLNSLLYVINYSENPDETIAVANKIIEKTSRNDLKYDALRFLAYAYKVKGDMKSAKDAIEQIPEIYFNKLTEMAYLLSGEEKLNAAQKQKLVSFENLIQMMWKIAEYYAETGEYSKAIEETEKALQLIDVIKHSQFDIYLDYFSNKIKEFSEYIN